MSWEISADFLRHLLHYDPLTGVWTWMNPLPRSKYREGEKAGRINTDGRRQIGVAGKVYYSARLAHLYMTGEWPHAQMDHINRIRDDDRWENLRQATQSQNSYNREWAEANGEWRGITPHGNKFKVDIGAQYLGLYDTFDQAKDVRDQALKDWAGPFAIIPERNVS